MMLLTVARGEGVYLDRFRSILHDTHRVMPVFVKSWRDRIVSRYPVLPRCSSSLLLCHRWFSRIGFGRDGTGRNDVAFNECKWMGHRSMAVLMSLTAVILYRFLIRIGLGRVALAATLAAALGSNLWSIGSQAMWQHGPAAFALIAAISLLHPTPVSRWRLVLAGLAAAILFSCRLIDGLFAVVMILWLARFQPRGLLWFLPVPLIAAVLLVELQPCDLRRHSPAVRQNSS